MNEEQSVETTKYNMLINTSNTTTFWAEVGVSSREDSFWDVLYVIVAVISCWCCLMTLLFVMRHRSHRQKQEQIEKMMIASNASSVTSPSTENAVDFAKQHPYKNGESQVTETNVRDDAEEDEDKDDIENAFEDIPKYGCAVSAGSEFQRDNGCEEVRVWLENKCGFEQYTDLFIINGYEALDIVREIDGLQELEEIGVSLRGHRTKIWSEVQKLKMVFKVAEPEGNTTDTTNHQTEGNTAGIEIVYGHTR